jgi:hypothetical protein
MTTRRPMTTQGRNELGDNFDVRRRLQPRADIGQRYPVRERQGGRIALKFMMLMLISRDIRWGKKGRIGPL